MSEAYKDMILNGLNVLPVLTKGWFVKEGTTNAYSIIEGKLMVWDLLGNKQYHDTSMSMATFADGKFTYQDFREKGEYAILQGNNRDWVMEKTDLTGFMTAGRKLVSIEHADVGIIDLTELANYRLRPASIDDVFYALHELDVDDIQTILKEATFWKEV